MDRQQSTRAAGVVVPGEASLDHALRAPFVRRMADTAADRERLQRITDLAARLTGAPSAQISIISDTQVVLAGVGAGASLVETRSPIADSLCTVTVRAASPVAVPDAPTDPRVRHLPPVTSGAVGAYLGVPLSVGSHLVGALCVYDDTTRVWTPEDSVTLSVLADAVAAELQAAELEERYAEDRAVWRLAIDAAGVGAFHWDLRTGEITADERLLGAFDTTATAFDGTLDAFTARVHPDDRSRVVAALETCIERCGELSIDYRILLLGGSTRWITTMGRAVAGVDGTAVRLVGAAFDSTAIQDSEARASRILETMPSGFSHLDRDWRFTYINDAAQRIAGVQGDELLGGCIWELFPDVVGSVFEEHYRRAVDTGVPTSFEAYYPPPLAGWYEVHAWPSPDGLSIYFHDITDRKASEAQLDTFARRHALLAEVTASLTETFDTVEAVGRLAQLLVPRCGTWCLVSLIDDPDPFAQRDWRQHVRDVGAWHADPSQRSDLERYSRLRIPALGDQSYLARTVRDGIPVVLTDNATEAIATHLEPGEAHDLYSQLGPAHAVLLPIHGRGRPVGALTVMRDLGEPPFSTDDVDLLNEVAARAGLALDNTRLFGRHRDLAEGLQRSMLTAPPAVPGLEISVRYVPAAQVAQVGGDWHDAFRTNDGGLTLVIGDVMGHDTTAAAFMGQLRAVLRGIAVTTGEGPAGVLSRVDEAMSTLEIDSTASAVVAQIRPSDCGAPGSVEVRWSNAGHPPPMITTTGPDGQIRWHGPQGDESDILLGIEPGHPRSEAVATLAPGSLLVLYTDGLIERREQDLEHGLEKLASVLGDLAERPADEAMSTEDVADELLRRLVPENPQDDIALVVVRVEADPCEG